MLQFVSLTVPTPASSRPIPLIGFGLFYLFNVERVTAASNLYLAFNRSSSTDGVLLLWLGSPFRGHGEGAASVDAETRRSLAMPSYWCPIDVS